MTIRVFSDIADFLFPRHCVMCRRRLNTCERSICTVCAMHLPRTDFCLGRSDSRLESVFVSQFPIVRAAAFFFYSGENVRHMLHSLKYYDIPSVGSDLGRIAAEELLDSGFFDGIDCIVPVPIHWKRMMRRNYNQSLYVARGLALVTGIPVYDNVVKRTVNNVSQTTLRRTERRANTENIFKLLDGERIAGKHILVVDDIVTTGSTVSSCAKTLAQARDVRISVFSLARAFSPDVPTVRIHPVDIQSVGMPMME